MGRKDILTKKYLSNPERFADVFNAFLFDGEKRIDASELRDLDTTAAFVMQENNADKSQKPYTGQKYRDIFKQAIIKQDRLATYVLLGIENQSDIHYAMPARNMLYNALAYDRQINETIHRNKADSSWAGGYLSGFRKDDRLCPVITLTIYWGDKEWDAPRKLSDMLAEHPAELDRYIDDIEINLFSIIDDETYMKCSTELRDIFKALHFRNNKAEFQNALKTNTFRSLGEEEANILSEFSRVKLPRKTPKGGYDMCKAVEEIRWDGVQEGLQQGLQQGLKNGQEMMAFKMFLNHDVSAEIAAKNLDISTSEFEDKLKQYLETSSASGKHKAPRRKQAFLEQRNI